MGSIIDTVVEVGTFGLVDDITGTEAAQDAATNAANVAAGAQTRALDYLKEREALPQGFRDQALTRLAGFYGMTPDGQATGNQAGFDQILKDPYVQQQIASRQGQSEDAILRNAGMTGGLRSGNVQSVLQETAPQVQQQVINEYLNGLQGFAGLSNNNNSIANMMQQIGMTQAQGITAGAQAEQNINGQILSGIMGMGQGLAFSDRELKDNIKPAGKRNGFNWYTWEWNAKAEELGFTGKSQGVMADEVEHIPNAVIEQCGYKTVNYQALGV